MGTQAMFEGVSEGCAVPGQGSPGVGSWPWSVPLAGSSYRAAQLRLVRPPAPVVVRPASGVLFGPSGPVQVDGFEVAAVSGLRLGFVPPAMAARLAGDRAEWFDGRLDADGQVTVVGPRLDPGPDAHETVALLARSSRRRQAALARDRFVHDDGWMADTVDDDGRLLTPEFASSGRLVGWRIPIGGGEWLIRHVPELTGRR